MFIRALLVIASGFIFIFSPGLPMNLISRYSPNYKRDLVYWGIGVWLVTSLVEQFFSILLRQFMYQGQTAPGFSGVPRDYLFIFLSALISAFFLGLGILLVLKFKSKRNPDDDLLANGLAMGFGAGLVAQVFTGITLLGAGFQVLFGNITSNITVEAITGSSALLLFASILALLLFRVALLVVSAVQGVMTARSLSGSKGLFWVGILVMCLFYTFILSIQLLMGGQDAGQVSVGLTSAPISIVTSLYYLVAFFAAYQWLVGFLKLKRKKK